MSSVKDLKKAVRRICSDLAQECLVAAAELEGEGQRKMMAVIDDVANLQQNAIDAASFHFDKLPTDFPNKKAYNRARSEFFATAYRSYREKFLGHVEEIAAKMNAALGHEAPKPQEAAPSEAKA